jgi:hypothetical protein
MEPYSTDPITSFASGSFDTTVADDFMESYYPDSQDSTLSSAPTDLQTPSAGSNPAELSLYNGDECIPIVYKKRKKVRQGYCWPPNTPCWSQIARMALSIHSIPAMSAEVERVFSSSKLLISDRRNRLGDDVICAVECMKSWEKAGCNGDT